MTDLSSFLAEQHAGEFDSTGSFTIAADKALAKLARSQLPDQSYWILKVMQFAAGRGAATVDVRIRTRTTRVAIPLLEPISVADLRSGLDSVNPLADASLDNLVTGLRAIGGLTGRKFALRLVGPEATESLFFDGERLSLERDEVESSVTVLILEVTLSLSGAIGQVFSSLAAADRRAGEATALATKAFTVPYSLTLDGRELGFDTLAKPKSFQQHLLWDFAPSPDGMALPRFLNPTPDARGSAFWQVSYHYQLVHKMMHLSAEPVDYASPSTLYWLRDGVIVKEERLGGAVGAFALGLYVDARGCAADLGGLNLRQSMALEQKKAMLRELLPTIVSSIRQRIASMDKLSGPTLGGWDAFVTMTSHIPLSANLTYDKPGMVPNRLNAVPRFRKKLLDEIKARARGHRILIDKLQL